MHGLLDMMNIIPLNPPVLRRSYKTSCEICNYTCFTMFRSRKNGLCRECRVSLVKIQKWCKKRLKTKKEYRKQYSKKIMKNDNNVSKDIVDIISSYL